MQTDNNQQSADGEIISAVSIIICCHSIERLHDIRKSVESSLNQTYSRIETIVAVDHNQELFHLLSSQLPSNVKVVMNQGERGLSDTRNTGIESATGDIITFIDDDAEMRNDCVEKIAQHFEKPSVIAVGGRSIPQWEHGRPEWFPEELDWIVGSTYKGAPEKVAQTNRIIGCNMSFKREAFDRAGMFSTKLGRIGTKGEGEDSEICMRIRQCIPGAIILYEPAAIVYHKVPPERTTLKYLISRSYSGGNAVSSISRMYAHSSESSRSKATERSYLFYLLSVGIPNRLVHFYRRRNILQLFAITTSIIYTGVGYIISTLRNQKF